MKLVECPTAARSDTEERMITSANNNNNGNDCLVCARSLSSERWGVASTCGHPRHLGRYHLKCWERAVALNNDPNGGGFSSCALCNGAPTGLVPVFIDAGYESQEVHCTGSQTASHNNLKPITATTNSNTNVKSYHHAKHKSETVRINWSFFSEEAKFNVLKYQSSEDPLGIKMGAYIENMETSVDIFLDRLLAGEINEVALGAFIIGCALGVLVINLDQMFFASNTITHLLPWLVRGLWLFILPLILPDIIRTLGESAGVKEPMKSSVTIISSSLLSIPLWLLICDKVCLSILYDMAGDCFE